MNLKRGQSPLLLHLLFFNFIFNSYSFLLCSDFSFSLPDLFRPGQVLLDTDKDGWADEFNLTIILSDNPDPLEIVAAAEMASRFGFESLAIRFDLVRQEKEITDWSKLNYFILVGEKFHRLPKEFLKSLAFRPLTKDQGLVRQISIGNRQGLHLRGGSPEALLQTTRAFFNRFPYLWDILGQETGETYETLEKAIISFVQSVLGHKLRPIIKEIFYEFPQSLVPYSSLQRLRFDFGEIKEILIKLTPASEEEVLKLEEALKLLSQDHRQGKRTNLLSFAGCQKLTFLLQGQKERTISLERVNLPRRFLTPSFRSPRSGRGPIKDFDLLDLFSSRGLYSDSNNDNLPDNLEGLVIIPRERPISGLDKLGLRIAMESAGLSFPIFYLAEQIEEKRALQAPILIGESPLTEELIKAGKLKPPALEPGLGLIILVPQAFPRTAAVVIQGADDLAFEKTLAYLGQTFPYLETYGLGRSSWKDVRQDIDLFLKGEKGAAEAYFYAEIEKILQELKPRDLEEIKIEVTLPISNKAFRNELNSKLVSLFPQAKIEVKVNSLRESQVIFEKEKTFSWEAEEAQRLLEEKLKEIPLGIKSLRISLAVSESPKVRSQIKQAIESKLRPKFPQMEVKVMSAYKSGFFWLLEEIAPKLRKQEIGRFLIRVAKEKDDRSKLKRFYVDPNRWLQELYPVDEILARELALPLEKIDFELKDSGEPIYEVLVYNPLNQLILKESFTPLTRKITYWSVLPEWGEVTITTSGLRLESEGHLLAELIFPSDLENFWTFYQQEVIPALHQHIMKKTGQQPTTAKQPYFKQLVVELEASEPDFRLNLDEEMVSSLEALHDEIYFDTLDYLRGITEIEIEDREETADTSRLSAPGNILPIIHPAKDGHPTKVKVKLEDWKASIPTAVINWKEKGHSESPGRRLNFPRIRSRQLRLIALKYNGKANHLQDGLFEIEMENENDYLTLLSILDHWPYLEKKGLLPEGLAYPGLKQIIFRVKHKELSRDIVLAVKAKKDSPLSTQKESPFDLKIPDEIISPEKCLELVAQLSQTGLLRGYIAGRSYEGREVLVIEALLPKATYISLPKLITFKPTLLISGRQHANEVSATTYLLKLAEKLIKEEEWRASLRKINLILLPLENPDGAALAYNLQKLTPHHCLHAGRYSSLGVDIGSLVNVDNPILPEAKVRRELMERWRPDIYLNLHGYPSHEWVQQFSGYTPYLFRDYWIPRGWFAFYRSLRLPVFEPWRSAGEDLKKFIIEEMKVLPGFAETSQKFYERYFRWATRWSPHGAELELYDGVNLYAKRRSSQETRLTSRTQITYIEETPELMDETAHGDWLKTLCDQGLAYLRAHLKYLKSIESDLSRLDEEVQERVRFQWLRRRPGKIIDGLSNSARK
ncbi:MAG: M14 family zinc carboxypeptidase [Candidatus Aminicenantes bacterium]|nr:M14 family zinc carboxypeptidase [Candidatus Aminicenantes bacterium]